MALTKHNMTGDKNNWTRRQDKQQLCMCSVTNEHASVFLSRHEGGTTIRFQRFMMPNIRHLFIWIGERAYIFLGVKNTRHRLLRLVAPPPLFTTGPTQASVTQRLCEITLHPAASPVPARPSLDRGSGGDCSSSSRQ